MISRLVHGRQTSEVYNRIMFLRDVVGWWEDLTVIKMGGPGKVVEGDGKFLIGRRKCGVGRYRFCFLLFGGTQHIGLSAIFVWIFEFRQSVLESIV